VHRLGPATGLSLDAGVEPDLIRAERLDLFEERLHDAVLVREDQLDGTDRWDEPAIRLRGLRGPIDRAHRLII
jgi:hypothetical protein